MRLKYDSSLPWKFFYTVPVVDKFHCWAWGKDAIEKMQISICLSEPFFQSVIDLPVLDR